MTLFDYFASFYDQISDATAVLNTEGEVEYANEAFSNITGISQVRYRNKKVGIDKSFISFNGQPFSAEIIQNLSESTESIIGGFDTKKILQGIGRVTVSKITPPSAETCFLFTMEDLTYENELLKNSKYEIDYRENKINEMNELIEILQRVRLCETLEESIKVYTNYLLMNNEVFFAANKNGSQFQVVKTQANPNDLKDVEYHSLKTNQLSKEIDRYLTINKITKYTTVDFSEPGSDQKLLVILVPFEFANSKLFCIFAFNSSKQINSFRHQSAIVLAEQLNIILNNLTLKETSTTDGLTKLRNSMFFRQRLNDICHKAEQAQIILFDVDFFKKINDTYGHPCGDAVLVFIGDRLQNLALKNKQVMGGYDITCARVGGEEFAILIPEKNVDFAYQVAEDLRLEIESSIVKYHSIEIKFTISSGVSTWIKEHGTEDEIIKKFYKSADDALYKSKKSGRNQVNIAA